MLALVTKNQLVNCGFWSQLVNTGSKTGTESVFFSWRTRTQAIIPSYFLEPKPEVLHGSLKLPNVVVNPCTKKWRGSASSGTQDLDKLLKEGALCGCSLIGSYKSLIHNVCLWILRWIKSKWKQVINITICSSCCVKIYSQCIVEIISGSMMHLKSIVGQLENESIKKLVTI